MLAVAQDTAVTLGGELRDEHMNLITSQVVEHYRQQIIEFARKKMFVSA
jgi:FtsZ-interacting cell division protein ZipA